MDTTMKLKATPKNGKVHLTVGDTTYALTPKAAIKLANQIGNAANTANGNQWADYADELQKLMQDLYKK